MLWQRYAHIFLELAHLIFLTRSESLSFNHT
ncbi:MAG: hypothetical protein ACI86M_002439 [Saprospiraceae bacterium]